MDASQWIEHAISLIFGGAGGIAAGLARLNAAIKKINEQYDALDKRQDILERRLDVLVEQKRAQAKQLDEFKEQQFRQMEEFHRQHDRQMEEIKRQVVAQGELSHSILLDKFDELRKEMGAMRSAAIEQQVELQRSLGAVEGTLKMIARNGCARACNPLPPDPFPSEPPTAKGRIPR
jgi:DNA repair exonuclease SbcCD ATPase subunit